MCVNGRPSSIVFTDNGRGLGKQTLFRDRAKRLRRRGNVSALRKLPWYSERGALWLCTTFKSRANCFYRYDVYKKCAWRRAAAIGRAPTPARINSRRDNDMETIVTCREPNRFLRDTLVLPACLVHQLRRSKLITADALARWNISRTPVSITHGRRARQSIPVRDESGTRVRERSPGPQTV